MYDIDSHAIHCHTIGKSVSTAIISMEEVVSNWYAIKTRQDFRAEKILAEYCDDIYFPKEEVKLANGERRIKAIIPHVIFIRTTKENALVLENESRKPESRLMPFWIYRYIKGEEIQIITPAQIKILKLLTAQDTTRCEIFSMKDFRPGQRVRVTGGVYQGLEGYVQRVKKNRHVVVRIEGICMIILPFIHPDLLEIINYGQDDAQYDPIMPV